MRIKTLLFFIFIFPAFNVYGQTLIQKNNNGYTLMRDGKPYYVKGVGGEVNFDKMVAIGANSLRTWGIENAQNVLDEAQKRGLTVMLGIWLQHERHGFDYDNAEKVKAQCDYYKTIVDKYKNHPALLLWGIGNELDLDYTNPNVWYAVQDLAKYIHQVDPNHPTSTVTAGLDSLEVYYIKTRCPDIDIYCINTYGDIPNVPGNVSKFGWSGPYMITEWGPNGHWESPQTNWGVSIEQTSTEKKSSYYNSYKNYIAPNKSTCLGSYAFLWGAKQEYTETWYGLFTKDNMPTEPIDALENLFTEKNVTYPALSIIKFSIDSKTAKDNVILKAEEKYTADLKTNFDSMPDNHRPKYFWRILKESSDKKSGGDVEKEAEQITGLIKGRKDENINFRAPNQPGLYRLFVAVTFNNKVSYANIPFKVTERSTNDKQAKFIKLKYTDMNSFNR